MDGHVGLVLGMVTLLRSRADRFENHHNLRPIDRPLVAMTLRGGMAAPRGRRIVAHGQSDMHCDASWLEVGADVCIASTLIDTHGLKRHDQRLDRCSKHFA